MQADFLLAASREEIDVSSTWNRRLLGAIPEAFLAAVQKLNKGDLRYSWTKYLSHRPALSDFFEHLETDIYRMLSEAEILESLSGELFKPTKLKFMPDEFRYTREKPLIHTERTATKYLSPRYLVDDKATLFRLGVQELAANEFLDDLQAFVSSSPQTFRAMPQAWHNVLAVTLTKVIIQDSRMQEKVSDLQIIPLKDGRWVAASQHQTYFADENELKFELPQGIAIGEIHPYAVLEVARKQFFIQLGARPYSKDMACKAIIYAHTSSRFDPASLEPCELISQAVFLFNARWRNLNDYDLWVATERGVAKGSEAYAYSTKPNSVKVLLHGYESRLSFLHKGYADAVECIDGAWMKWLCKHLRIAEFPRLVLSLSPKLALAQDFGILAEEGDPLRLLLLLRDRWEAQYSRIFVAKKDSVPEVALSKATLRQKIAALMVPCQGGGQSPLGRTVLPLPVAGIVLQEMGQTYLQVPTPEDVRWEFLRHFDVKVYSGVSQCVQYLRQMKEGGASVQRVTQVYLKIWEQILESPMKWKAIEYGLPFFTLFASEVQLKLG